MDDLLERSWQEWARARLLVVQARELVADSRHLEGELARFGAARVPADLAHDLAYLTIDVQRSVDEREAQPAGPVTFPDGASMLDSALAHGWSLPMSTTAVSG